MNKKLQNYCIYLKYNYFVTIYTTIQKFGVGRFFYFYFFNFYSAKMCYIDKK